MPLRNSISFAALTLALTTGTASADLTGPEVWADWKDYWQGFGYTMTATESQSGDVLTVSDVTMSMELPEGEGDMSFTLGTLTFTDQSDGSVSVGLPTSLPIEFDMTPDGGEAVRGSLNLEQDAPSMIVSGDPGDFTYDYSADEMRMSLGSLAVEGADLPAETFNISVAMTGMTSKTRTIIGDLREYDGTTDVESLTYDISFDVPDGPEAGKGSFKGTLTGLSVTGGGAFGKFEDPEDFGAMLEAGFDVTSRFTFAGGNSVIALDSPDGPINATTSSTGGALAFGMGLQGISYDVEQNDLKVDMETAELPFPVAIELAKAAFNLGMPLAASDDPQGFAFGFTMGDFTISDAIWNLVDPAGQLPRDPATLSLDLSGAVRILNDLFDPEAMASGTAPGEIDSLDIGSVLIRAAGAEITGGGAFTFDNSDMQTFDGIPRPEGALNVTVVGANGLIDTLVKMGLLPQEQAMGARMMMGMFGVPQGNDTLTSKIEVNGEGHVLANGQRLR